MKTAFKTLLFFLLLSLFIRIQAQTEIADSTHTLNGHKFISNSFIKSPFINTSLNMKVGMGQTSALEIPVLVINGEELYSVIGDLAYFNFGFEYQQAVKDWMAFSLKVESFARYGTETPTLLSQGVDLVVTYDFGWLFKFYKNKESMLSGLIEIANNSVSLIDLYGFTQGIIDSGKVTPENQLVKTTPTTTLSAGVNYAYAINRVFGITSSLSLKYGESADRFSDNEWFFNFGICADADLNPEYDIPIGFSLMYFSAIRGANTASVIGNSRNIAFQVNFTGKSDFDIGLVFNYQMFAKKVNDQSVNFTNVFFDMKYYF